MRCGSASANRRATAPPAEWPTTSSGGPTPRVSRNAATNGAWSRAGRVVADRRGGLAVSGQAQREHPVGAGQGGDDPPPAGGALLVPMQQQQRRPGPGLQVLGVHPVHDDPAVVDDDGSAVRRRHDRHGDLLVVRRTNGVRHQGLGQHRVVRTDGRIIERRVVITIVCAIPASRSPRRRRRLVHRQRRPGRAGSLAACPLRRSRTIPDGGRQGGAGALPSGADGGARGRVEAGGDDQAPPSRRQDATATWQGRATEAGSISPPSSW